MSNAATMWIALSALGGCQPVASLHGFSNTPGLEHYPGAAAVWLERETIVRFRETDSAPVLTMDHCQAVKLLTNGAVKDHSTIVLPYERTDTRIARRC